MATIKEIHGNLFNTKCQTIVNTVNCDGFMGKGIALVYKKKFPEMFEKYSELCKDNKIRPGILSCIQKLNHGY